MRQPTIAKWLEGVALRDLQLHRTHAACVDARGNVYQWGDGFFGPTSKGSAKPMPTLMGMVPVSVLFSAMANTTKIFIRILSSSSSQTSRCMPYLHLGRCTFLLQMP